VQPHAGRACDLDQEQSGSIARIENGRTSASSRTLERIAKATNYELAIDFRPVVDDDPELAM
jgi:transcriptional regulator with XRE-family HTH domain